MTAPSCRYDPDLGRVTTDHRDDCTNPEDHRGCALCTAPHCAVCGRAHATNDHPTTCTACVSKIRDDLTAVLDAHHDLAAEATDAARDGHLAAAAPIPGGTATVLRAPANPMRTVLDSPTLHDDHHPHDPTPPLAVLTHWVDTLTPSTATTVPACIAVLADALTHLAQHADPDTWRDYTREVRALRTMLERALHNERAPERGVSCFECGDELVRRYRDPNRCRHMTPAKRELQLWLTLGYPEAVPQTLIRDARRPCGRCDQGGIKDPTVGLSWECPGCRRDFTAGEYAHAVRRDLLEGGEHGDGWTHVAMAAEAATTMTGFAVPPATVRKWMDRGQVSSCCRWEPGRRLGIRLVYWPDVAELLQGYRPRARRRSA